ncbi:hypothetical protein [Streptosporangium sp. V21-05]|uniref:hypothetical protein n=1 Tax=Streptosporangium sp. V21-05 TaxID=3446115 RepID=UPI003F52B50B
MTSNYYALTRDTPADDDGLHIGQSANGWEFLFRAHTPHGLTTTAARTAFLSQPQVRVRAENGVEMPAGEFLLWATTRPEHSASAIRERPR